jgi:hypothetical protein
MATAMPRSPAAWIAAWSLDRGVDGRVPEGVGQALHLQTELVGRNR